MWSISKFRRLIICQNLATAMDFKERCTGIYAAILSFICDMLMGGESDSKNI